MFRCLFPAVPAAFLIGVILIVSGCATARLHAPEELAAVGRACGTAEGEVVQDAEEPRILFLYAIGPPRAEIACVARWSRRHHLHLAYIQAVNWTNR
jgi:hypothetical protein